MNKSNLFGISKPKGRALLIVVAVIAAVCIIAGVASVIVISAEEARTENVEIICDGTVSVYDLLEEDITTVADLLERDGVILSGNDIVNYPLDEILTVGMKVEVTRIDYTFTTTLEPIPFETEYEDTTLLAIGDEQVKVEGVEGVIEKTITTKFVNGKAVSSYVSDTKTTAPVNEVILKGTALSEPYCKTEGNFKLENGVPTEYAYVVTGKVTAYTAREGCGTYSGRPLVIGSIAVNPDIIPFGSEVYIASLDGKRVYGYAIASDTGDLTEVVADVFMGVTSEHYKDACQWGAQFCNVYVLTVGDNSVSWM